MAIKAALIKVLDFVSGLFCMGLATILLLGWGISLPIDSVFLGVSFYQGVAGYICVDITLRLWARPDKYRVLGTRLLDLAFLAPTYWVQVSQVYTQFSYSMISGGLALALIGRIAHCRSLLRWIHLNPAQLFLSAFLAAIIMGGIILSLPISIVSGEQVSFIDACFTAASAVCVTGLVSVNIADTFTSFGHGVIILLIQLGGIGMMTFYALVSLLLNRKFNQGEALEMQATWESHGNQETRALIYTIIRYSIGFELLGMVGLFFLWRDDFSGPVEAMWMSGFHSISAFCNSGFSLFSNSLEGYVFRADILGLISFLVIIGGIGFPVIFNIRTQWRAYNRIAKLRIQTKIPILVTGILLFLGTLLILIAEWNGIAFKGLSVGQKVLASWFHAVTTRTAGFQIMDLNQFGMASIWVMLLLMFIGASPGSTGGGIKTSALGVLIASLWNTIQGRATVALFGRRITIENRFKAISIVMVSGLIITCFLYLFLLTEEAPFIAILFETVSAFSTVGLSLGITHDLSVIGKLGMIILMFLGRVGPLSFAFALARRKSRPQYSYPEERIILG